MGCQPSNLMGHLRLDPSATLSGQVLHAEAARWARLGAESQDSVRGTCVRVHRYIT